MIKRLRYYLTDLHHTRRVRLAAKTHFEHLFNCERCTHAVHQSNPLTHICSDGYDLFCKMRYAITNAQNYKARHP